MSGSFKGKGHAKELLNHCINDAKVRGKSGICVLAGTKKTPFLSDKSYLIAAGFEVVDKINGYELLSLNFDNNTHKPKFAESARAGVIDKKDYVVYYSPQCPYTLNCIAEMKEVALERNIGVEFIKITTREQAKAMPCVFNNFAVFYNGKFAGHHLLNRGSFEKLIESN